MNRRAFLSCAAITPIAAMLPTVAVAGVPGLPARFVPLDIEPSTLGSVELKAWAAPYQPSIGEIRALGRFTDAFPTGSPQSLLDIYGSEEAVEEAFARLDDEIEADEGLGG